MVAQSLRKHLFESVCTVRSFFDRCTTFLALIWGGAILVLLVLCFVLLYKGWAQGVIVLCSVLLLYIRCVCFVLLHMCCVCFVLLRAMSIWKLGLHSCSSPHATPSCVVSGILLAWDVVQMWSEPYIEATQLCVSQQLLFFHLKCVSYVSLILLADVYTHFEGNQWPQHCAFFTLVCWCAMCYVECDL